MMTSQQGIIRTKRYLIQRSKGTTACNFEKNRSQTILENREHNNKFLDRETNATKQY